MGTATHQGTLSHFYPLCTQKYYRNKCVLHPSGTSSVILQTETGLKIHFSISEILLDHGRYLIKLNSIYISQHILKFLILLNALNLYHFKKSTGNRYLGFFSNIPYLLSLKFVCKRPLCISTFYEKLKLGIFKRTLTISYELILFSTNVFVTCSQKNYKNLLNLISLIIFNTLLLINAFSSHTKHGTHSYQFNDLNGIRFCHRMLIL